MAAKQMVSSQSARRSIARGLDVLANTVKAKAAGGRGGSSAAVRPGTGSPPAWRAFDRAAEGNAG